ncbi:MAG TPA: class I SAM-dependent methyltransferase [Fibrobacteria bacterium]|nr:class I SAM-dependent methyltransferase [Fibrobacteria bacterium]
MMSWDDYWKQYSISKAERWMIGERHRKLMSWIDSLPGDKKRVIEIGCGFGSNIRRLKQERTDIEAHALDFSEISVANIKDAVDQAHRADCQNTGLPEGHFDFIYSSGLMEHFRDEGPFVREMYRILKPGGLMATFVPARWSIWQLYQLMWKLGKRGGWIHGYEKAYSKAFLHRVMVKEGWKIEEDFGLDPFSFNGFAMKLLNKSFEPAWKKSPLSAGYTEICVLTRKPG